MAIESKNIVNIEEKLRNMFANINEWLKFAEAKNFGLFSITGAVYLGITQVDFEESIPLKWGFVILSLTAGATLIASLLSLFPFLTKVDGAFAKGWISKLSNWIDHEHPFENIHFYGHLKNLQEPEFEKEFTTKIGQELTFNQYEKELVTQILYNAKITWLKFQLFKIGGFFFLCGFIPSIVFLLALKFLG